MFIENNEYEPFALEFKRCYKELISKLSEIWNEYDFEMSVGDPYAFPNYTKEEIEKKNNELNNKIKKAVDQIVNSFSIKENIDFIKYLLGYLTAEYKGMRWLCNQLDYDAGGKIKNPIDLYSTPSVVHQIKLNFIIGSPKIIEGVDTRDYLTKYVLMNYKEKLDEQAKIIEELGTDGEDKLEVLSDHVIFIWFNEYKEPRLVELGTVINRKY